MPNRSGKPPTDPNLAAKSILEQVTDDGERVVHITKDAAAVELGRKGGLKGGKARANALTPEQRSECAKKAAEARWGLRPPFDEK